MEWFYWVSSSALPKIRITPLPCLTIYHWAQHRLEILEKVLSFQNQAHSFNTCFQRFTDYWIMRGSNFIDRQRVESVKSCRALRPGLQKLAWAFPLDLCQCAVTGTSETSYNAALNSGARVTCFSERKEGRHYYVSRGSWHDLIHQPFFYLCQGNRLYRIASLSFGHTWLSA